MTSVARPNNLTYFAGVVGLNWIGAAYTAWLFAPSGWRAEGLAIPLGLCALASSTVMYFEYKYKWRSRHPSVWALA